MFNRLLSTLFLLAFLLTTNQLVSQRVLIVPFDQFQFDSTVPLEEISQFNAWESETAVYSEYVDSMLSYMNQSTEELSFFQPSQNDIETLRNSLPRIYKRDPVSHFGVDIEPILQDSSLEPLMTNMGADYILFVTKYRIVGKLVATRAGTASSGKFLSWSAHFIDYEIYNSNGKLIAGADRFPFTPHNPNSETFDTKGTLVTGLKRPSKKLVKDIAHKLDQHQSRGRVTFKNKVK